MADEAKAKGNAAFSAGDFSTAVRHFPDAIEHAPTNHVLYSNRSAAYASLNKYSEALVDAEKTVELKADWPKGYKRLGAAHLGLGEHEAAVFAYKKGLEVDPSNEALKSGLTDAQSAMASRSRSAPPPNPFGNVFSRPEMWAKLTADSTSRAFLQPSQPLCRTLLLPPAFSRKWPAVSIPFDSFSRVGPSRTTQSSIASAASPFVLVILLVVDNKFYAKSQGSFIPS